MDIDLNLDGAIRPGLDLLGNEIVIALKKRSRFKQNPEIYRPGLVLGCPDRSLLEYELARMEQVHAGLGRYTYASQEAFTDVSEVELIIKRPPPESPVQAIPSGVGERIIEYYLQWVRKHLEPGSDSDTYGETVTADVAALQGIFERITLGKYVAECKFRQDPDRYRETQGDSKAIRSLIVNPEREKSVIDVVVRLAEHYDFDVKQAREILQWVIETTIEVEIRYIQHCLSPS